MDKKDPSPDLEKKQDLTPILVSFLGHNRVTRVAHGMAAEDLKTVCSQLYSDILLPEGIFIRYFDESWSQWVDITSDFHVVQKCKIEIVAEGNFATGGSSAQPSDEDSPGKKKKISELLKSLTSQSGKKSSAFSMVQRKQKADIKVQLGWMHYNKKSRNYSQVKAQSGGGTIQVVTARTTSYDTILQKAVDTFPNGSSKMHGGSEKLHLSLANIRGQEIKKKDFNLETLFNDGGSRCKLYLLSKEKDIMPVTEVSDSSTSLSDEELPTFNLENPFKLNEQVASTSSAFLDTGTPYVSFKPQVDQQPQTSNQGSVSLCGICADRTKNSFFIPCGHSLCAPCAIFIEESENKVCPFCKLSFDKVGTLYE